MPISLFVASADEHFRESIRESLLNVENAKVASTYPEVSSNLYIRVLQDLERTPDGALIVDLASDPETALKAMEKVKQAAPEIYIIASNYHADAETIMASLRAGCNDFLVQPVKRSEFRDVMARLERAPRRVVSTASRLGRMYAFVGAKGGVGTTTVAVNFATALAQRKDSTVLIDLDVAANDCALQLGTTPQHSLEEIGDNLSRMDQALFEGFVTRDPTGVLLVSPPDQMEHRVRFTEPMFRELAGFLVEKYDSVVIDAGRAIADELVLAALDSATAVFLVLNQRFPAIRNAQRSIAALLRLGFPAGQLKIVVNDYQKKADPNLASLEQIRQTLNQPVFQVIPSSPAAVASVTRGRPFVADRAANSDLDRAIRALAGKMNGDKTPQKAMEKSA
jgi:pilus assembly protein CpaE